MPSETSTSAPSGAPTDPSSAGVLDAVLWDMDGTLVDTEPYWIEAETALVHRFGGTWSTEHAHALVGNPLLVSAAYLQRHGGVDLGAHEIVAELQSHVVAQVATELPWRPGARALLVDLAGRGVRLALVTMSWTPLAQAVLAHVPSGTFDVVVTGDQVTDGKPHPEPYLQAMSLLGVEPGRCVAIEDSATGLASAEAAGVATVAVPHLVPIPAGPGRTVVASLSDVDHAVLLDVLRRGAGARDVSEP